MWRATSRLVPREFNEPAASGFTSITAPAPALAEASAAAQRLNLLAAALETISNAIVITDCQGVIQWSNPAFTTMTGYSAAEVVGQTPRLLNSGRHPPDYYRGLWQTIQSGHTWRGQFINRRKDGSLYQGEQTITPVLGTTREVTHFVAVMNDVTARRQAEADLSSTNRQLQQLLANSPVVIYGLKWAEGKIIPHFVSEGIKPLLDFRPAETLDSEWWLERLHPDDRDQAVTNIAETLRTGESRHEYRVQHRDGSYRWVEDHRRLMRDANGQPDEFIGVWSDVTERRRVEEVLRLAVQQRRGHTRSRLLMEPGLLGGGILFLFVAGHAFGWFRWIFAVLGNPSIHPYLDETIASLALLAPALGIFWYRRWQESETATLDQQNVTSALRTLHEELEKRIQLRTAELAQANDSLRAEGAERRKAEQQLRSFFTGASAGLAQFDRDLRFVTVNATMAEMNGVPVASHLGHTVDEVIPMLAPSVTPLLRHVLATNRPLLNVEIIGRTSPAAAEKRCWMVSYFPIGSAEEAAGVGAIVVEITERKRAETEMREQREQWQTLFSSSTSAMIVLQGGRLMLANPAAAQLFGLGQSELLGRSLSDFLAPEDQTSCRRQILRAAAQDEPWPMLECKIRHTGGTILDIESTSVDFHFAGQAGLLVEARDITDRKQAETALAESHRQFRDMLENVDLIATILDREGTILFGNKYLLRLTGWTADEVTGRNWFTTFVPDSAPELREPFLAAMAAGKIPSHYESHIKTRQGELRQIAWNNTMLRDGLGNVIGTATIGEDVTDRKRAAALVSLQHAVTNVLAEGLGVVPTQQRILAAIARHLGWEVGEWWAKDHAGKELRCAASWQQDGAGYQDLTATSRQMIVPVGEGLVGTAGASLQPTWSLEVGQDPRCPQRKTAARLELHGWIGLPIRIREEIIGVAGFYARQLRPPDPELISLFATLGHQLGQFVERNGLAEQFRQVQKLEAIGTLAGGIAHDFNNIIAAITGYTELAKMDLAAGSPVREHLDAVLKGSNRAADLVRQILAFSRKHDQERKPIQLRHVVAEAVSLLRATVPTMIDFDVHLQPDLPAVQADATQIHQIVMNLGTNAWHAMKDRPGCLGFALERCAVDAHFVEAHPRLKVGPCVRLSVTDTGHGMPREIIDRIFEPFFTTKPQGEGTGLGLSVVHGIMESHEGVVTVYSQPGEGTVFRLYFPALGNTHQEGSTAVTAPPPGHGERVLLVDDEAPLALMGRKILERLGYVVDARTNPVDALAAVRAAPDAFDLVVTDLAMPTMSGTDLVRELHAIRPDLPLLLVTGYTSTLTPASVRALGISDLLLKPLSIHTLGTAVNRALTEPIQSC